MAENLGGVDIGILLLYAGVLIGMGVYYRRKCRTSEQFMIADRGIPAWAAGLAVMSAYTSSISYIATPGKAFDTNWHPMIFAICIFPVAWLVCKYVVPYYREQRMISVYTFLEDRLGAWGRIYASFSFVLYMVGRVAVILYLSGLLLSQFLPSNALHPMQTLVTLILVIGFTTIIYTLLGGMEAVIWTDVMQSVVMIAGIAFCAITLSRSVFSGPEPLIQAALENNKFSFGSWQLSLSSRTIWVMIIYGVTENLRNLLADQNYVQKYCAVPTAREAKRSVWVAMLIYIPLTAVFLYIGTALFAYYSRGTELAEAGIVKGDQVFPYFIATRLPAGLKGLIVAAIMAAAMSTVDSALNCSATVLLLDFHKRFFRPGIGERASLGYLRLATVVWGVLGTGFALLMINAESALDVWWTISGIFGGGILGLFLLSLARVPIRTWQGIVSIGVAISVIAWATFARNLPESWRWAQCNLEEIIIGAVGTAALMAVAFLFALTNRKKRDVTA